MGLYKTNKGAKSGTIIECPVCHKKFKKIQYSQAFCCGKCKDKYHNIHDGDRHLCKSTEYEHTPFHPLDIDRMRGRAYEKKLKQWDRESSIELARQWGADYYDEYGGDYDDRDEVADGLHS